MIVNDKAMTAKLRNPHSHKDMCLVLNTPVRPIKDQTDAF